MSRVWFCYSHWWVTTTRSNLCQWTCENERKEGGDVQIRSRPIPSTMFLLCNELSIEDWSMFPNSISTFWTSISLYIALFGSVLKFRKGFIERKCVWVTLIPESTDTPAPVMIVVLPLPFLRNWVTSCIESERERWGAGGNAPSTSPGTRIFSNKLRLTLIVDSSRRLIGSRGSEIGRRSGGEGEEKGETKGTLLWSVV